MTPRAALFALLLGLGLGTSGIGAAQVSEPDPTVAARAAAERLGQAMAALDRADKARDRVKALTETVRAFEDGLQAMREGLRQATIREQALARDLAIREAEIAKLLGVLQTMGTAPAPALLLHPAGPTGTARSGMIMSHVTPALNATAESLRGKLEEMRMLRRLQANAAETLQDGLTGVQEARAALSQAVADRDPLPRRFTEDPVRTALLISSTETLEGFASGLADIAVDETAGSLPGISHRKGKLPLPVQGRVLHRAGEADAAGIHRPGIVVATRPRALVSTPAAATIRYHGPLLDYGNVMILEPQSGLLLVVAGLDVVYGDTGQVLPSGAPIGLMAGADPGVGAILQQAGEGAGTDRTETLYIEVREDNKPVDPETWFRIR